ncbi:methylmalonyl-CoA mutase subunit beta [Flavobacterium caeni]|uniref:Methylmalonyl-CoA mutase n=1 Tax=Flavobacterium caeni TaxID=490189 RepID=A0A1G5K880_9FLAO|nr:methylmalonyl-CoA mutase subunit beta [Flavobacterium caeni]SCY96833.1 methylmalonyl-CoA mutase [Flavobacterium caeni]
MADQLFSDFEPVSSKQWKQQIQFELKGADYNDTLVWESPEGIKVKPFYHSDEVSEKLAVATHATKFKIGQDIFVHDLDKSIWRAKDSIARGAESIRFTIADEKTDVEKLLNSLALDVVSVHFHLAFLSIDFVKKIDRIATEKNATVFCHLDPIGHLTEDGNWFKTAEKDNFETLKQIAKQTQSVSFLSINARLYQNGGANIVQQIAYALSHANEYLNRVDTANRPVVFDVAVGTNYFFEIAKLRALRILFKIIASEYNHNQDCHIIATPTRRNKTIYDYNVNMLRTTTECMSAVLGGADTVCNLPYDALYHKSNEFGERISRNQLLVLKSESYFDKVDNPADGSYYIETLTQQIAEKALELFKEIEANGGFLVKLGEGNIQKKIAESAEKEQQLFDLGNEVLLGTNKYPNKNDRMAHDLELYPFVKNKPRKTLITPIIPKRLAEKIEQERLEHEKNQP